MAEAGDLEADILAEETADSAAAAMVRDRCFRPFAASAGRIAKFHLNRRAIGQCFAVIASKARAVR